MSNIGAVIELLRSFRNWLFRKQKSDALSDAEIAAMLEGFVPPEKSDDY